MQPLAIAELGGGGGVNISGSAGAAGRGGSPVVYNEEQYSPLVENSISAVRVGGGYGWVGGGAINTHLHPQQQTAATAVASQITPEMVYGTNGTNSPHVLSYWGAAVGCPHPHAHQPSVLIRESL
jgi:hypothetical protein